MIVSVQRRTPYASEHLGEGRIAGKLRAQDQMIYEEADHPLQLDSIPARQIGSNDSIFFVGTIQAFIFTLLTIIYFGMAREGLEEEEHGEQRRAAPATAETGG